MVTSVFEISWAAAFLRRRDQFSGPSACHAPELEWVVPTDTIPPRQVVSTEKAAPLQRYGLFDLARFLGLHVRRFLFLGRQETLVRPWALWRRLIGLESGTLPPNDAHELDSSDRDGRSHLA